MSKRQSKHASKAAPSSTGERKPTRAIEGADEDTLENSLAVLEVECMMKRGHLWIYVICIQWLGLPETMPQWYTALYQDLICVL